jgi:hypothetical protein
MNIASLSRGEEKRAIQGPRGKQRGLTALREDTRRW